MTAPALASPAARKKPAAKNPKVSPNIVAAADTPLAKQSPKPAKAQTAKRGKQATGTAATAPSLAAAKSKRNSARAKAKALHDSAIDSANEHALQASDLVMSAVTESSVLPSSDRFSSSCANAASPIKSASISRQAVARPKKTFLFDPKHVADMAKSLHEAASKHPVAPSFVSISPARSAIAAINECKPLNLLASPIQDQGAIVSMALSPSGELLATFSSIGHVKIWSILDDWCLLQVLRDTHTLHIDEFFTGAFLPVSPDRMLLAAAGKVKDRHRWSATDEDNHVMPATIKIFDVISGEMLCQLSGHEEEILFLKAATIDGNNYLLSMSQDGYIKKWHMSADWSTNISSVQFEDGLTCMAFFCDFVPNTGGKYLLAACDDKIRLYDFELAKLLTTFESGFSSYCDYVAFLPLATAHQPSIGSHVLRPNEHFLVARGVEMLNTETLAPSCANSCRLYKLALPTKASNTPEFALEEIQKYEHVEFHANSWLMKPDFSAGNYLAAPTLNGRVFVFNLESGQVTAILHDHDEIEVRQCLFHPSLPYLFTCADGIQTSLQHDHPFPAR